MAEDAPDTPPPRDPAVAASPRPAVGTATREAQLATATATREARLAAALRANLRRRKAQARGREDAATPPAPATPAPEG